MTRNPLYLIDAYGLIYRSYFAFMTFPLKNNAGKNVSALFGFARTVISLLNDGAPAGKYKKETPKLLAAVFDSRTPTFRHKMYGEYKATRQKAPDDLHAQVPLVEEFLAALNIPCLRADGFEADDIIASLAKKCQEEKRQCYILSSDKDLLQLVGKGTFELRPSKSAKNAATGDAAHSAAQNAGQTWEIIGPDEVKKEWCVPPEKILDLLSLTGDASDNIPGVKGIGEKTALEYMSRYGSLDEIYKNTAGLGGARGKKIAEGKESAYFSQSLIRLETNVPLPVTEIDELSAENLNRKAAAQILLREGIRQSAKQLDPDAGAAALDDSKARADGRENHTGAAY
jgi:DNA polymerase-1